MLGCALRSLQYVTWQVIRSQPTFAHELREIDFFDELQVGGMQWGHL